MLILARVRHNINWVNIRKREFSLFREFFETNIFEKGSKSDRASLFVKINKENSENYLNLSRKKKTTLFVSNYSNFLATKNEIHMIT